MREPRQREYTYEETIVVFLDILGFDKLVQERIDDVDCVKYIDETLYAITLKLLEYLRNSNQKIIDNDYFKKIMETVKVKCVYDNIILSLPLTNITFGSEVFDKNTVQIHHLDAFFFYVALVSTLLISRMGHFHRGGLAIGSHYESERENYLFIFSEAHDKAVKLEREAEYPVALLDNSLRAFLEEMAYPHIDKFFYKDVKDRYCFDTYSCFEIFDEQKIRKTLDEIKMAFEYHIKRNAGDEKILSKLKFFAGYHNRKVGSDLKFPEFAINIGTFNDK